MQYSFVAAIDHLRIEKPIGSGLQIAGPLKLTNSTTVARRLVNNLFGKEIGQLEARSLLSGGPYVYAVAEYPLEDQSPTAQLRLLDRHLRVMQLFFNILWLIKDNSGNFSLGFLQYPYHHPMPSLAGAQVSSNGRGILFTDSSGSRGDLVLDESATREAVTMCHEGFLSSIGDTLTDEDASGPLTKADRVSRAFYFLQAARSAGSVPEKVVYYCTCLEALVSTDSTELAHKVAERAALLVGKDSAECL